MTLPATAPTILPAIAPIGPKTAPPSAEPADENSSDAISRSLRESGMRRRGDGATTALARPRLPTRHRARAPCDRSLWQLLRAWLRDPRASETAADRRGQTAHTRPRSYGGR